ncbi:hypothetical protein SFRURICE_014951 [Spodoptera frugiperda]|nr:hypothetical protein SFRURICE_014951 [Spodoptera frugiperda]
MTDKMDSKVFVLCFCAVFVAAEAIEMNLTNEWKQDIGWEIYCSWRIPNGDSLQSVRLHQNNQQFLIFRPETDGDSRVLVTRRLTDVLTTNCALSKEDRQMGTCVLTFELYQPQKQGFMITCEIPHDFTGVSWNATSKLWDAWSVLTYTSTADTTAVCTPEVSTAGRLVKGKSAEYNSAECSKGLVILIVSAALYLVFLR